MMLTATRRYLGIPVAVSVLLFSGAASAQVGDADVSGAVTDPSGAPVSVARLLLPNEDSGVVRAIVTDSEGRYRFPALAPGRYSLKAEAPGFRAASVTGIRAARGRRPALK